MLVSNEEGIPEGFVKAKDEYEDEDGIVTAHGVGNIEWNNDDFYLLNNFAGEEPEDSLMYFIDEDYGYFPLIDSKEKQKYQSVVSYANGFLPTDDEYYQKLKNEGVTRLYYRAGIKYYVVFPTGGSEEDAENGDLWGIIEDGDYNMYFESTVKYIDI